MLLCVDSAHITGWHFFCALIFVFFCLWNFDGKLSRMHAGVNLAFVKSSLIELRPLFFLTQTLYLYL